MLSFCKAATLAEICSHDYVLTPGRDVGAAEVEKDGVMFEGKMSRPAAQLGWQQVGAARLDALIRANLEAIGYAVPQ